MRYESVRTSKTLKYLAKHQNGKNKLCWLFGIGLSLDECLPSDSDPRGVGSHDSVSALSRKRTCQELWTNQSNCNNPTSTLPTSTSSSSYLCDEIDSRESLSCGILGQHSRSRMCLKARSIHISILLTDKKAAIFVSRLPHVSDHHARRPPSAHIWVVERHQRWLAYP